MQRDRIDPLLCKFLDSEMRGISACVLRLESAIILHKLPTTCCKYQCTGKDFFLTAKGDRIVIALCFFVVVRSRHKSNALAYPIHILVVDMYPVCDFPSTVFWIQKASLTLSAVQTTGQRYEAPTPSVSHQSSDYTDYFDLPPSLAPPSFALL